MRKGLLILAASLIVVGLALSAAGCGSKKKSSASPTATEAAAPTAAATAPATAPPGQTTAANAVSVKLLEYHVVPKPASASAGEVTFNATNAGSVKHELIVIKTDLGEENLPTKADGSVDKNGPGIEVIGEIAKFAPGTTESHAFTLEPGKYVLICNVVDVTNGQTVSHYHQAMHTAFTVLP